MESLNLRAEITGIIASLAGIDQTAITDEVPLYQIGIDSLMALEVIAQIEKSYKIEVPEEAIPKVKTLRDLLQAVGAKLCVNVS